MPRSSRRWCRSFPVRVPTARCRLVARRCSPGVIDTDHPVTEREARPVTTWSSCRRVTRWSPSPASIRSDCRPPIPLPVSLTTLH